MTDQEYIQSIRAWREQADRNLRRENGWLAAAGLFWLEKGANVIGSDPQSDILLPARAPARLGTFEFDGENVVLEVETGLPVEVNGVVTQSVRLETDQHENPGFITFDDIRMVVVRRPRGTGVRLWDNAREERRTFPGRQWYPIKEEYRLTATYTRLETPHVVKMPDIFGALLDVPLQALVTFEFQGGRHELLAEELPDGELFLQFMDLTNGSATYPSGRYHYTEAHSAGRVVVDFNKAYSPPCAFTAYATCTFAPQENRLPLRVEAGELYPGQAH